MTEDATPTISPIAQDILNTAYNLIGTYGFDNGVEDRLASLEQAVRLIIQVIEAEVLFHAK